MIGVLCNAITLTAVPTCPRTTLHSDKTGACVCVGVWELTDHCIIEAAVHTHTHTTPRHFPPSLPPFLPFSPFFSFVCRYVVIRDASVADWFEALVRSIADFSSGVDGSGALHPPSGVGQPQQQQQLAVDSVHVAVVVVMWLWLCGCDCGCGCGCKPFDPILKVVPFPSPLSSSAISSPHSSAPRVSVSPHNRAAVLRHIESLLCHREDISNVHMPAGPGDSTPAKSQTDTRVYPLVQVCALLV